MTGRDICKIQSWIENKYGEQSAVYVSENHSVILKSSMFGSSGVNIHTDGIIENNSKDGFDKAIISGFSYVVICLYGKEYSGRDIPRIIVYLNSNKSCSRRKCKKAISGILNNY